MTADLVGDVGGTNIRLALVERGSSAVGERWSRPCDDFENLDQAIGAFLQTRRENPVRACIAVAGPVANGSATLTNRPWRVSEEGLRGLGFLAAHVVNDFVVLAFGAPALGSAQTWLVGPDRPSRPDQPLAVLGPGTGFGAGVLVPGSRGSAAVATEAGHIAFAPTTTLEEQVAACVAKRHGRTSIERILSGPGLANLHHALGEIDGRAIPPLDAAAITQLALAGEARSLRTASLFLNILASTAGDLALAYGARGGLFIAGGIAPRLRPLIDPDAFRRRFEDKGRMAGYLRDISVRVITAPDAALIGAAAYLRSISDS